MSNDDVDDKNQEENIAKKRWPEEKNHEGGEQT